MFSFTIVLVIYASFLIFIGLLASRSTHTHHHFLLGNRTLGAVTTALGVGASDMSGWLLMALPGAIFVYGANQLWMPLGLVIGAYINWKFISKRLRIETEKHQDSLTISSYFFHKFGNGLYLRLFSSLLIIFFFVIYMAAGFVAMAFLLQSVFHLSYVNALLLGSVVIVLYTTLGGFLAINWIDVFQGLLILFALIIVPLITFQAIPHTPVRALHFTPYSFFPSAQNKLVTIALLGWGLGYFGQPHILSRFMAIKNHAYLNHARRICMTWMILSLTGAVFVGFAGQLYFHGSLKNPEMVFLILSKNLFNPVLFGVLFAAVISAIMSTISAQMIACCSAITEDLYTIFLPKHYLKKQESLLWINRIIILIISIVTLILAIGAKGSTLLSLVGYAWSGFGASFGPIILISLYFKIKKEAAFSGMITGAVTVVLWHLAKQHFGGIFNIYELTPAFLVSVMVIVVVTFFQRLKASREMLRF